MCPKILNQNVYHLALRGGKGGEMVRKLTDKLIGYLEKWMGNIDNSIKGLIENNLDMVKERVETAILNFPEGDLR